jgi:predicted transposase YbfD/YdcC
VLGQVKVSEKSNEIVAIPALLGMLAIEGAIVTVDAMGCQRDGRSCPWAIENSLHWVMDMIFRDDECRVRTDHAPANFTIIKHMTLNLIRGAPGKDSFRLKRKIAAWDAMTSLPPLITA